MSVKFTFGSHTPEGFSAVKKRRNGSGYTRTGLRVSKVVVWIAAMKYSVKQCSSSSTFQITAKSGDYRSSVPSPNRPLIKPPPDISASIVLKLNCIILSSVATEAQDSPSFVPAFRHSLLRISQTSVTTEPPPLSPLRHSAGSTVALTHRLPRIAFTGSASLRQPAREI